MSRTYTNGEITFDDTGMDEFEEILKKYARKVTTKKALDAVEAGAQVFVKDLLKLPKPRRNITAPGYTHLVDSFALQRTGGMVKVGWGKYYGPMLEHGTRKMEKRAHLVPLFEKNKEKYYKVMTKEILD